MMIVHASTAVALALSFLVPLLAQASAAPDDAKILALHPTSTAPIIDGRLDDAVWQTAAVISDLTQIRPGDGTPASERTEIYVTYDKDALYVGARMWDSGGREAVVTSTMKHGQGLREDDRIAILVDPFNTGRNGYRFETNTNGVRHDMLYQNNQLQPEWTVIWDAEGQLTDEGWTAEIAIPFKSLPFDPHTESWGFNVSRAIRRKNEESVWVARNRDWNPGIVGAITGLKDLDNGVGLDVVPGLLLSRHANHVTGIGQDAVDPSLELYYRLTTSLTGSLTVNTDFSASEVDDRQVNLTRFNLFFPEKRDFFLNDADLFEFGRIGAASYLRNQRSTARSSQESGRPFFSRRIGLSPLGTPVALEYGGKLSGRIGRYTIGAMAVRQDEFADAGTPPIAAGNAFIGRVTADVLNESSIGMVATSGDFGSNADNTVVGADFLYTNTHLAGNRILEGDLWLQKSQTPGLVGRDTAVGAGLRLPTLNGFRGGLVAKQIGQNFRPALGFVSRYGVREYSGDFGYGRFIRSPGYYTQSYFTGIDVYQAELIDGGLQSQIVTFRPLEMETRQADAFRFFVARSTEVLQQPFTIYRDPFRSLTVPVGRYTFAEYGMEIEPGAQRRLSGKVNVRSGDFYDGTRLNLGGEVTWKQSRYVRFKVGHDWNDIKLPRGRIITRLMRASTEITFSNELSWTTLAQYDNVSEIIGVQSRLQWVPNAGQELLLAFNRNLQDFDRSNSFDPLNTELNAKASYTLRF